MKTSTASTTQEEIDDLPLTNKVVLWKPHATTKQAKPTTTAPQYDYACRSRFLRVCDKLINMTAARALKRASPAAQIACIISTTSKYLQEAILISLQLIGNANHFFFTDKLLFLQSKASNSIDHQSPVSFIAAALLNNNNLSSTNFTRNTIWSMAEVERSIAHTPMVEQPISLFVSHDIYLVPTRYKKDTQKSFR